MKLTVKPVKAFSSPGIGIKLTVKALKAINSPGIRIKLAIALNCTDGTIIRYIGNNDDNLTKAAALKVIKNETGLSEEEILSEEIHGIINS